MTKILINNFPRQAQYVHATSTADENDKVRFHVGYDNESSAQMLVANALSSFFSSLIIHNQIYITFDDFYFLLDALGAPDTVRLLDRKIIKIVGVKHDNAIWESASAKGKLQLSGVELSEDIMARFEKSVNESKKISLSDKAFLIQYTDNARVDAPNEIYELKKLELEKDLIRGTFSGLGIATTSSDDVRPQDALKLLRLADITEGLILQSKLGLDSISQDGFVKQYLDFKVGALTSLPQKDSLSPFSTISKLKGIPDLYNLYKHGTITMDNILACRESFSGGLFRQWYSSTDYSEEIILRTLVDKGVKESPLRKFARVIYPNVVGLIGPLAGLAASAVDSYIVGRLLEGWNPSLFLDDVFKQKIDQYIASAEASEKRKLITQRFGKVNRNDSCPCQSGKKFKNCHGS